MITLRVADYAQWRVAAWRELRAGHAPGALRWRDPDAGEGQLALDLADGAESASDPSASAARSAASALRAPPPEFRPLAEMAALHRDPLRWDLLYRVLWRLAHDEPLLLEHGLDDDAQALRRMAKAVQRDIYWMQAHVRFRRVVDPPLGDAPAGERWVAWHVPEQRVLAAAAPFFIDRFGAQRWAILTPEASMAWDGARLAFGPGAGRDAAPRDDAVEALWCTYYASIFNPARPKPQAMLTQMPRRTWGTLPEAAQIDRLLADAPQRVARMIAAQPASAAAFVPAGADWATMRAAAAGCRGCELCGPATQTVFGEGPLDAALAIVGEQPGDDEDRAGRPFVGAAGQVLDALLAEAGVERLRTYVTNAVKHFRFQLARGMRLHKTPDGAHINACRPWLEAELTSIKPKAIVCLGATAAKALLGRSVAITREHGVVPAAHLRATVVVTFHPAAILRAPDAATRASHRAALLGDLRLAAQLAQGVSQLGAT